MKISTYNKFIAMINLYSDDVREAFGEERDFDAALDACCYAADNAVTYYYRSYDIVHAVRENNFDLFNEANEELASMGESYNDMDAHMTALAYQIVYICLRDDLYEITATEEAA